MIPSKEHTFKWSLILFIPLILFVLYVGCNKKSEPTKTILRVWQTETDKDAVAELNKIISEFEKQNPDVDVQLESVAWNSLSEKLTVALRANNEPDVAHLEPFMVNSLVARNLLLPIDDLIQQIQTKNKDTIFEGVRDLQLFQGKRYGIAYAVGTTGFAYRADIKRKLNLQVPKTWGSFKKFCESISESSGGKLKVLLPGGDPFFIDQLFAELVANNGGKFFDPLTYKPLFTSNQIIEAFVFLEAISPWVDAGWQTQGYLDQFNRLGRGEAGVVPVTYARASKAIEKAIIGSGTKSMEGNSEYFALMDQPIGPSFNGPSIATIDCEPYVIFKSAENRHTEKSNNAEYAKKFLRMFYDSTNYMNFVSKVPIHLTPIFKGMSRSREYTSLPHIKKWKQWADQTVKFLDDPNRVRPILMPDISEGGRAIPFLLEFQANRIISQAVTDVVSKKKTPKRAAQDAQIQAEQLIERLGYKKW